jgi:protein O-mannosyl-transferase
MAMYWSGLSGAFLLDDTPNLNVIAQLPETPTFADMFNLASTGFAGPLGRPVSVFSFLLQHESWPDPRNFKFINVLIHLANGCLLALCAELISRQWRSKSLSLVALAAIVFVWLAHPIQISSVLYVVQRMNLLSATFSLLSILFYLLGRPFLLVNENARGLALLLIGLIPFAFLAVLSKENGVLIYLYVLVLEYTLFTDMQVPNSLRRFRQVLLAGIVLLGIAGLAFALPSVLQGYDLKPFSLGERVLTQFPAIASYLASIALLLPNSFGIFHDDFANGQGLTLVVSLICIAGLIATAIIKRTAWPLFSFAVLWFAAGHALESTLLPLEFYFEHRNYLPLFGIVFALVLFLEDLLSRLAGNRQRAGIVAALIGVVFMASTTVRHTRIWGNGLDQAYYAAYQHPESVRAQSNLVEKLSAAGDFQLAFDYHLSVLDPEQLSISPYIRWLEFSCILPGVEVPDDEQLSRQARSAPHDYGAIFSLNNLVFGIQEGRCPGAPIDKVGLVLGALASNPNYAVSEPDIVFFQALLEASANDFTAAASLADESFRARADVRVGLYQVNWLLRSGQTALAETRLQELQEDFARQIAGNSQLSVRLEFLLSRLGTE